MLKFESQGSCPMVKMDFDITITISKRSQKLYRLKDNVEISLLNNYSTRACWI